MIEDDGDECLDFIGQEVLKGPEDAKTFPFCYEKVLCRHQCMADIGDDLFFILSHFGQDGSNASQGHVCLEADGQVIVGEGDYRARCETVLWFLEGPLPILGPLEFSPLFG